MDLLGGKNEFRTQRAASRWLAKHSSSLPKARATEMTKWAAKWRSKTLLDGKREHLMLWQPHLGPHCNVFRTRRECLVWIAKHYGYIRTRKDLQREPHGWKVPIPVRVFITETPPPEQPHDQVKRLQRSRPRRRRVLPRNEHAHR